MKKIALFILALVVLCSCSKDDTPTDTMPANGQYIYENENITVAISVDNSKTDITVFENGSYVYQSLHQSVSGSWPTYKYEYGSYGELALNCRYTDSDAFTATVSKNQTDADLPNTMLFKFDNRVLDANGDGILDEKQPDLLGN